MCITGNPAEKLYCIKYLHKNSWNISVSIRIRISNILANSNAFLYHMIRVENVLYFLPQISFYRLHYVCCRMYIQVACVTAFSARYKKEEFRFASCGWEIMMIVKNIGDGGLNQPCVWNFFTNVCSEILSCKNATQTRA